MGQFTINHKVNIFIIIIVSDSNPLIDQILVKDYDEMPLKGPTSIAYNKEDNCLYITDAGNFHTSNLYPNNGSLFVIDLDTKIMKPIIYNKLSYPSDVVYDSVRGIIYVSETFTNRIIRFSQHPSGVFNPSVFFQFNGRLGPSALSLDENGNIYVSRYEYQIDLETDTDGIISVLNPSGIIIGELIIPKLSEITGMYISTKKKETLYLTEKSSNGVLKIKLSGFISELDKLDDSKNISKF